jgi:hypothetical protein
MSDAQATRDFSIQNIITNHCGKPLTPDLVDQIVREIIDEMRSGGTAWAWKFQDMDK